MRVEPNEWDASKCLKGEANKDEVRPDDDLGHTNRFGFRNIHNPKPPPIRRIISPTMSKVDVPPLAFVATSAIAFIDD